VKFDDVLPGAVDGGRIDGGGGEKGRQGAVGEGLVAAFPTLPAEVGAEIVEEGEGMGGAELLRG
jgi:hypothetical protein